MVTRIAADPIPPKVTVIEKFSKISKTNKAHTCLFNYYTKIKVLWSSYCGSMVMNAASIHEDAGLTPGLAQWVKDLALLQTVE